MSAACKDCKFWARGSGDMQGTCRARAPVFVPDMGMAGYWPKVYDLDWCGEFQPHPPEVSGPPGREYTEQFGVLVRK